MSMRWTARFTRSNEGLGNELAPMATEEHTEREMCHENEHILRVGAKFKGTNSSVLMRFIHTSQPSGRSRLDLPVKTAQCTAFKALGNCSNLLLGAFVILANAQACQSLAG